ncbi:hypothetical protein QFC19_009346 [Naganishia cerealis]|uniref:Uncharacterized protein n=1 Tax=Naganishia cerealis TaxID=610337 RepID=A0ACC2UVI5_9TREE|nr:hypothetical protein QFC19_009346 [Naganishia cerealis]
MPPPTTPPSALAMHDRSPSPDIPQPVVYGRLHHFRGKSSAAKEAKSKQVFNIDALQVVFGREESCDIRIYADNVSRKHCKIVVDLLTGKVGLLGRELATLHVLSSHGLKLNRVSLPGGTVYTLQDDDVINVMERKFRFEYASETYDEDESSLGSLNSMSPSKPSMSFRPSMVQPIIPPSPMAYHAASPNARRSSLRAPTTPFRAAPSTRMHLFPKDYASQEVRVALENIGVEMEPVNEPAVTSSANARKSRKEDFVYLEDREELDAEESMLAQTVGDNGTTESTLTTVHDGGLTPSRKTTLPRTNLASSGFSTPQPAKKTTRVPRTSLAPRTKKSEAPAVHTAAENAKTHLVSELPQTPSSIPLPPPNETPYVSSPFTSTGPSTPSIYPSLDQLSAFSAPQTPSPQPNAYLAYQTPRNVPLPGGGETPYGSIDAETPDYKASRTTREIDPVLVQTPHMEQEDAVEDVEMEDVSAYHATTEAEKHERSRSPGPDVLALSTVMMTPRNVPLPFGGSTPYSGVPATPMSAFTPQPGPASPEEGETMASSTPAMPETPRAIRPLDGPVSLRRRLLLRSAHKVMQEQISRRDLRRTMGVGSGLIGTPMRPRKVFERPTMEPMSPLMTPISETPVANNNYDAPQTPLSAAQLAEQEQITPSRVALPSPEQTQYDSSFGEMDARTEDVEEYAEPLRDEYDENNGHTSLAMYQTDFEGEEDDAEGESDPGEEQDVGIESAASPATPFEDFDEIAHQDSTYFATADATDAVQFPSPSASQVLFQTRMVEVVSDDDDLVDRSLDISPGMDEGSDEECGEAHADEAGHEEAQDDSMDHEFSREEEGMEEGDKENEPPLSEEDDDAPTDEVASTPVIPASPSRAVRRPVAEEYYTPQPLNRKTDRRGIFGRKSLSSIGGPAVRGTPRAELAPMKQAFARLSLNEREIAKKEGESEIKREEETQEEEERSHSPGFSPIKVEAAQSTPSALSSRHPAMNVPGTISSDSETETTPLQGLKNKLKNLRRKSTYASADAKVEEKPFDRRATLGVVAPGTPIGQHTRFEQRAAYSAAPLRRFMPKLEQSNPKNLQEAEGDLASEFADVDQCEEPPLEEDGLEPSSDTEAWREGQGLEGDEEQDEGDDDDEPSVEEVTVSPVHTPVHKSHFHDEGSAMVGSSAFQGIREMLKTPKATPGTPQFSGIRQMFTIQPEVSTPEMSGIVDLFPEVADTPHEEDQSMSGPARSKAASKLPTRSRLAVATGGNVAPVRVGARGTTATSKSRTKAAEEVSGTSRATTSTTGTGVRRTRAQPVPENTSSDVKPRVTRTRVTQALSASTSTDDQPLTSKVATGRAARARTATAESKAPSVSAGATKSATRSTGARTTRAKAVVSEPAESVADEDGEADPLEDITVPEPDPEDIKPVRKTTRTGTAAARTTRPLATRSALPQPSEKIESPEPEKPKTRTRTAAGGISRSAAVTKSSTESDTVVSAPSAQPVVKKTTRTAAASRLTAPTAASKARSAPPPAAVPVAVRKTRATATSVLASEGAEASAIPKRVTRARK